VKELGYWSLEWWGKYYPSTIETTLKVMPLVLVHKYWSWLHNQDSEAKDNNYIP